MNRNTLLVAIAVIAVAGIAVGLFLAGQNGELAGALEPAPTSLDLTISSCSPVDDHGLVSFSIAGHLVDSGGLPVADRSVTLIGTFPGDGTSAAEQFVTRSDGSFRVARSAKPVGNSTGDNYQAFFGGDAQYQPSNSDKVYRVC